MKYPLIIHKDKNSDYSITVPDLPGYFSAGSSLEEAIENAEEAILTHIEGLLMDNEDIPEPKDIDYHKEEYGNDNIIWANISCRFYKIVRKSKKNKYYNTGKNFIKNR